MTNDDADRRQRLLTAALTLEPSEREELLEHVLAALARIGAPIGPHEDEAPDARAARP